MTPKKAEILLWAERHENKQMMCYTFCTEKTTYCGGDTNVCLRLHSKTTRNQDVTSPVSMDCFEMGHCSSMPLYSRTI